jgi:hypothetical protein
VVLIFVCPTLGVNTITTAKFSNSLKFFYRLYISKWKYTELLTKGIGTSDFFLPQPIIHIPTISWFQILKIIITESTMSSIFDIKAKNWSSVMESVERNASNTFYYYLFVEFWLNIGYLPTWHFWQVYPTFFGF